MPDLDSSLSRSASGTQVAFAAKPTATTAAANGIPAQKPTKTVPTAARADYEPIYMGLKAAVGENWARYKDATSKYLLGYLSREEYGQALDICCVSDLAKHLHNRMTATLLYNCSRDLPDQPVAPWVTAETKPTNASKPVLPDAADQGLKAEVMLLPLRDRRRLKEMAEALDKKSADLFIDPELEYQLEKRPKVYHAGHTSAGGNKTNVDMEVRKHYAHPLASETGELPNAQSVQNRAWLICHEYGLKTGAKEGVAGYVEAAMEAYVKEMLLNVYQRTRLNGPNLLSTASYKRIRDAQEAEAVQAKRARTASGLLPIEQAVASQRAPLSLVDFRFSLRLGDPYLARMPILAAWLNNDIAPRDNNNNNNNNVRDNSGGLGGGSAMDPRAHGTGRGDRQDAYRQAGAAAVDRNPGSQAAMGAAKRGAAAAAAAANSVRRGGLGADHVDSHPEPDTQLSTAGDDDSALGWRGAGPADMARLDSILDDCLAFGGGSGGGGF